MSIEPLLNSLDKLEKMHKSLLKLAYHKTDLIKDGDMEALDQTLKDEQAHVLAISQLEQQRQKAVTDYFKAKGFASSGSNTVAQVIEAASTQDEKDALKESSDRLVNLIDSLKQQNELNQKMIYQSLQYVNMTLDLMRPEQNQVNYSKNEARGSYMPKTNFDSQA